MANSVDPNQTGAFTPMVEFCRKMQIFKQSWVV